MNILKKLAAGICMGFFLFLLALILLVRFTPGDWAAR